MKASRLSLWLIGGIVLVALGVTWVGWDRIAGPKRTAAAPLQDPVLEWLRQHQGAGCLLASDEKTGNAYTYDQALAAIAFVSLGEPERARRILEEFERLAAPPFKGYCDFYPVDGHLEPDARAGGPNAWILLAINLYTQKTGDPSFLPLARTIADWLLTLQTREGGIAGGFGKWGQPMDWVATEHNLDAVAAFRDLATLTGEEKYRAAAVRILAWLLKEPYSSRLPHPANGRQDPNYATDLSSWGVLALGARMTPVLDHAERMALNSRTYLDRQVTGFDFGGAYGDTTWPDRDAVWFEGTGQMVCAYQLAGRKNEAERYLASLTEALTPSANYVGTTGLPYASNPGTPPYAGWVMPSDRLCVSSSAWYLFARYGINPFCAYPSTESANETLFALLPLVPSDASAPLLDDFANLSSLALGASYRARGSASARWKIAIERVREVPLARLDFLPKGETCVYPEFLGREKTVPRVRFVRTFVDTAPSIAPYRQIEIEFHADGSRNWFALEQVGGGGETVIGRWPLAPAGWRTVRANLAPAASLEGYGLRIEGMDIVGSVVMVRKVRLCEDAAPAPPPAPEPQPIVDGSRIRLTGMESMKVGTSGTVGVYGAAETDWKVPGPKSWFVAPTDTEGYGPEWLHDGLQSFRILWRTTPELNWGSFSLQLGEIDEARRRPVPMDLSRYRRLVFWARGANGGEAFKPILRTASSPTLNPDVAGAEDRAADIWRLHEIDLAALLKGKEPRVEMIGLDLDCSAAAQGTVYTDDWWLEEGR